MTENLAHRYSSESTQRELSNEYQHDRVWGFYQKPVRPFALDKSSLSIGRVKEWWRIGDMPKMEGQLSIYLNIKKW